MLVQCLNPNAEAVTCDFSYRSAGCIRLGKCLAGVLDLIPRGPAGSRSGAGLGDPRFHHHPGLERAGARRRVAAWMGAGGGHCGGTAWRRIGVLDRPSRSASNPQRLAHVALPASDCAQRGSVSPLGLVGCFLRPVCAADQGLCADYGRCARHGSRAFFRGRCPSHPAVGASACIARSGRGIRVARIRRNFTPCRRGQALLDFVGAGRCFYCRARVVDYSPEARQSRDDELAAPKRTSGVALQIRAANA
jgi:hypothetical protein